MMAVGIDVGKASLDLAVDGRIEVARYPNTKAGITKVIRRLQTLKATRIVVEATGS